MLSNTSAALVARGGGGASRWGAGGTSWNSGSSRLLRDRPCCAEAASAMARHSTAVARAMGDVNGCGGGREGAPLLDTTTVVVEFVSHEVPLACI